MHHQSTLTTLKFAYLTAFLLIALLSTTKQAIIQYTLARELFLRSYSNVLFSQAVASQRIQRNTLLLTTDGTHTSENSELGADVKSLETNHALLLSGAYGDYSAFVRSQLGDSVKAPSYPHVDTATHTLLLQICQNSSPCSPYTQLVAATHTLLSIEGEHLAYKVRVRRELPALTIIFYSEKAHLAGVELSIAVVNADIDLFIHRIQLIELTFWLLTVCVLLCEALLVLKPAFKQLGALSDTPTPHTAAKKVEAEL